LLKGDIDSTSLLREKAFQELRERREGRKRPVLIKKKEEILKPRAATCGEDENVVGATRRNFK